MMSITSTAAGTPLCPPRVSGGGRRSSRCAVRAQAAGDGGAAADGAAAAAEHKSVEIMRKFSEQYARRSSTFFCSDKSVTAVVIKGLADHKDQLGAPLCPCRHYDDKAAEAAQGFWNCPCVPMRERKECHCMLFLTPDNDFAGEDQAISLEEIKEATSKY
ncbi:ferredoxin-thioredoxin reductase catalytic chain, chloroplastic [Triticum aestivum]|uniref:ferredoxin-thioredoxin reductase catalytic chain, chloroplastic n=1 Tax=Triticum aestivum TaxID=4565 RepID=UPI001D025795|nr:ferredoxin-thioredoxin reductase catalytic chain, chloroplastic-like [Triticum aestivum]